MTINYEVANDLKPYTVPNGMALSVFNDKYARSVDGGPQSFQDRAREMALGNCLLDNSLSDEERVAFSKTAMAGLTPMSGRHLQHGDDTQSYKNIEAFTNCSTAPFSFLKFYLLLNGSGVGRDYSTESCRVDWEYMPNFRLVLDGGADDDGDVAKGAHPDFINAKREFDGFYESLRVAQHKYDSESEDVRWITVRDSREGWAEVIATLETAAFHRRHQNSLFVFDFSKVRCAGSPIKGMQDRPAQGPLPLMRAMAQMLTIKGAKMKAWKQALFIDHYLAACVVMGDVRRAARMATKWWKDKDIIEFIDIKRGGFLWSANDSILVDDEFWAQASSPKPSVGRRVFEAAVGAAYHDKTGEPGFINVHKLTANTDGFEDVTSDVYINKNCGLELHPKTYEMIGNVLEVLKKSKFPFITNPCGEIVIAKFGGYCVIGDVVLSQSPSPETSELAVALTAKALVRTNRMPSLYQAEVKRTNRIGVGLTGIFEYAWSIFKLGFHDLIQPYDYLFGVQGAVVDERAMAFWNHIGNLRTIVEREATEYAKFLGMVVPHTFTTIKPSGTISKVMCCTEGAHLPPFAYYIRWVICQKDTDKHADYVKRGYPVKDVSHAYTNCVVVGFPTKHKITTVIPTKNLVTSYQVTMEDQFKWIKLIEKFWMGDNSNNQVSYTMKYDGLSHDEFSDKILEWQKQVRCCAVMPYTDKSAYAYLPEEPITVATYRKLMKNITDVVEIEDYSEEELMCDGHACPIT